MADRARNTMKHTARKQLQKRRKTLAGLVAGVALQVIPVAAQTDPGAYSAPAVSAPPAANRRDESSIGRIKPLTPRIVRVGADPCDRLAADPLDHDRVVAIDPVEFVNLDGPAALAACEQSHRLKSNTLRFIYQYGRAKEKVKDFTGALALYRIAADRGYPAAFAAVAYAYDTGEGVGQDETEALRWYQQAASRNNVWAMFNVGYFHNVGRGVAEDDATALEWYRRAADGGNARAMNDAGFLFETSNQVPRDIPEARRWYLRAAEAGNIVGMANIANFMLNSIGGPADLPGALKWYETAEKQG